MLLASSTTPPTILHAETVASFVAAAAKVQWPKKVQVLTKRVEVMLHIIAKAPRRSLVSR